jgi:tRNA modification GTPase
MSIDTIAAIATPTGIGSMGVVRVSGPGVKRIGLAILGKLPKPRFATFSTFRDPAGAVIDQGIALLFRGPCSFTGEDILELQGHGGPVVMDLLLSCCLEHGARLARPGEFSERAFLNGKIDLVQAEAIADLIESSTSLSAKLAIRSLQGAFSRCIHSLIEDVINSRTFIEATLDFPDEDIDVCSMEYFKSNLQDLIINAEEILSDANQGERIREGLTVVIAGRPNAGKSSLLNALLKYDAAIVTPIPGTTRDVLHFDMQVDGLPVRLIDTAGIRDTNDQLELEGIRRAREQMALADHILWVYDGQFFFDPEELKELQPSVPVTLVRNKIDIASLGEETSAPDGWAIIGLSALTGYGMEELRNHIKSKAVLSRFGEGSFIARRRHIDSLRRGLVALRSALLALENDVQAEVIALELQECQRAFGEITGEYTSDDLLGRIFSTFCIGK